MCDKSAAPWVLSAPLEQALQASPNVYPPLKVPSLSVSGQARVGSDHHRHDAGAAEEVQRASGPDPQRSQQLPGEEASLLPTVLLPVQ